MGRRLTALKEASRLVVPIGALYTPLKEKPDTPVRELARIAGISPATASDVRRRVLAGEAPVPGRHRSTVARPDPTPPAESSAPATDEPSGLALEKLLRDPSLRMREEGRHLLRLLHENEAAEWLDLGAAVPPHCTRLVRDLARHYAAAWLEFAQYVEERERLLPENRNDPPPVPENTFTS